MKDIGVHYIFDIMDVEADYLSYAESVRVFLQKIVAVTGLHIEGEQFKQFDPVGVTGMFLLSESHISIHTWPEHGYAGLDVFSCRTIDFEGIIKEIEAMWNSPKINFEIISRGIRSIEHLDTSQSKNSF